MIGNDGIRKAKAGRLGFFMALVIVAACQTTSGAERVYSGKAYSIVSPFGSWVGVVGGRRDDVHIGVDIVAPAGTPVYAATSGTVVRSFGNERVGEQIKIFSRFGSVGFISHYVHLQKRFVRMTEEVETGQLIGAVGKTGEKSGDVNHLHFGIGFGPNYDRVDPEQFLFGENGGLECVEPGKQYSRDRFVEAPERREARFVYPVACTR